MLIKLFKYFAAIVLFCGCSDNNSNGNVAGNSAETGSPELAGILFFDNGTPAAKTRVFCVPSDFNANSKANLPANFVTETDSLGYFSLDSVPANKFSLEAYNDSAKELLLLQNLNANSDTIYETLKNPGAVFISLPFALNNKSGVATVIGSTILKKFLVEKGKIFIDALPPNTLDLILYLNENDVLDTLEFNDLKISSNDTLFVTDLADTLKISFVAPLALPNDLDSLYSSDIPLALHIAPTNIDLDSVEKIGGRWEAVRISPNGACSKTLPITRSYLDITQNEALFWVKVDSLNVSDSLKVTFNSSMEFDFAKDVFATNRSYALVWHFDSGLESVEDFSEKGYFPGTALNVSKTNGVIGNGAKFDTKSKIIVENSAIFDSSRTMNLNFNDYFCFSIWVQLQTLNEAQTIFEKFGEYALRYTSSEGFIVDVFNKKLLNDSLKNLLPDSLQNGSKLSWASGKLDAKNSEWIYISFNKINRDLVYFFVNDTKVYPIFSEIAFATTDSVANFTVGGFSGKIDEFTMGACARNESWAYFTYLNQKAENYWPKFIQK